MSPYCIHHGEAVGKILGREENAKEFKGLKQKGHYEDFRDTSARYKKRDVQFSDYWLSTPGGFYYTSTP